MRTGNDILGKKIITFLDGKQVGKVHDLIFDHKKNVVLGFLTDEGGWFSSAQVLPLERVKSIGEDAVIVETADALCSADERPEMEETLAGSKVVRGTKLMTNSGKLIGSLTNITFDEVSGKVESYEVSGGLFADMYNGRSQVPATDDLRLGDDVAFVPDEMIELLEAQVGGLKGAASTATDAAKQAGTQVKDSVSGAAANVDTEGIKAGAHEKTDQLKEGAGNLWETVKNKAGEYKDQAAEKTEEYRIRKALGHPASRVVLAKDDSVILNVGDIITHEAVDKARSAGELEVLLTSVYDKDPELTTEDMKAKAV